MGIASQDAIKQFKASIDEIVAVDEQLKNTFESAGMATCISPHAIHVSTSFHLGHLGIYQALPLCRRPGMDGGCSAHWHVHQGYPIETLVRFLKAREWNVAKAHKMLVDCLNWRIHNGIDNVLAKPIIPADLNRAIRDSQLIGLSGYSKEGRPVFAIGVGLSTFDKASVHYYVQSHIQLNEYRDRVVLPSATKKQGKYIGTCLKVLDMTGLKLSALSQIKLVTIISTIDDLNYPEKTDTYYIVNAPYIFSACWKVVKPLLQERTRRKVQVLQGCGRDELLKVMDYASLPHFCRREGSGSSRHSLGGPDDCFSFDHAFHQQLYNYIKQQSLRLESMELIQEGSLHVDVPDQELEGSVIVQTIESQLHMLGDRNGLSNSLNGMKINGI